jgi:hypothetical protein
MNNGLVQTEIMTLSYEIFRVVRVNNLRYLARELLFLSM